MTKQIIKLVLGVMRQRSINGVSSNIIFGTNVRKYIPFELKKTFEHISFLCSEDPEAKKLELMLIGTIKTQQAYMKKKSIEEAGESRI